MWLLMLSAIHAYDACVSRRLYGFSSWWPVCVFSFVVWFGIFYSQSRVFSCWPPSGEHPRHPGWRTCLSRLRDDEWSPTFRKVTRNLELLVLCIVDFIMVWTRKTGWYTLVCSEIFHGSGDVGVSKLSDLVWARWILFDFLVSLIRSDLFVERRLLVPLLHFCIDDWGQFWISFH